MKIVLLLCTLFLCFGFTNSSTTGPKKAVGETNSYNFNSDFIASIFNCELEERFETQFPDLISDVTQVSVHRNARNDYYYAVYGLDIEGQSVVEYFKTTEEEVATEKYNYIEMNENTMRNLFNRQWCREKTSPPWNPFCNPNNNGFICGVSYDGYNCLLF